MDLKKGISQPANTSVILRIYTIVLVVVDSQMRSKIQKKRKPKKKEKSKIGNGRVLGAKIPKATPTPNYISPNLAFFNIQSSQRTGHDQSPVGLHVFLYLALVQLV